VLKKIIIDLLDKPLYRYYLAYKINRIKKSSYKEIIKYIAENEIKKLHIGCGGHLFPGWLNSDIVKEKLDVIYLDASQKFPIVSGSFDYIFSEHVFEHLNFRGQINYLKECFRILKPGGKIRIATPNVLFLIELFNDNKSLTQKNYIEWNYRTFLDDLSKDLNNIDHKEVYVVNNYFRDWGHQLIHSPASLHFIVYEAGFSNLILETIHNSRDHNLKNLENHSMQIGDEFNQLETMVIEAEKPLK